MIWKKFNQRSQTPRSTTRPPLTKEASVDGWFF